LLVVGGGGAIEEGGRERGGSVEVSCAQLAHNSQEQEQEAEPEQEQKFSSRCSAIEKATKQKKGGEYREGEKPGRKRGAGE
jgi:hypothetical protein